TPSAVSVAQPGSAGPARSVCRAARTWAARSSRVAPMRRSWPGETSMAPSQPSRRTPPEAPVDNAARRAVTRPGRYCDGVIVAVGIDVVLVDRFIRALSRTPLLGERLFTEAELSTP